MRKQGKAAAADRLVKKGGRYGLPKLGSDRFVKSQYDAEERPEFYRRQRDLNAITPMPRSVSEQDDEKHYGGQMYSLESRDRAVKNAARMRGVADEFKKPTKRGSHGVSVGRGQVYTGADVKGVEVKASRPRAAGRIINALYAKKRAAK